MQVSSKRSLPPEWQQDIITRPLPRNMHPVHHENRRAARAKAYDKYSDQAGAFFVDAAGPLHNRSTATVVHWGPVVARCISVTGIDITVMEEASLALAMRNPIASFVLTDSQAAYRNFARGQVGHLAQSILQQAAANRQEGQWKQLLWVPGHGGARGNQIAHASARELLHRDSAESSTAQLLADQDDPQPLLSYSEILQHLRLSRRTLPPPDPKLDKATQVPELHLLAPQVVGEFAQSIDFIRLTCSVKRLVGFSDGFLEGSMLYARALGVRVFTSGSCARHVAPTLQKLHDPPLEELQKLVGSQKLETLLASSHPEVQVRVTARAQEVAFILD
ncbi:hypothetical protein HPB49_025573 [Dermacentor silvarum]|uniref:Uncharacterized protein n=1 Tax=Dermacentor silvarum TaxID=543639 RepID=A0ACB8CCH7_DERSI|nr:hypothetical protein HPB49_025573 [Dermacentor silvarum]